MACSTSCSVGQRGSGEVESKVLTTGHNKLWKGMFKNRGKGRQKMCACLQTQATSRVGTHCASTFTAQELCNSPNLSTTLEHNQQWIMMVRAAHSGMSQPVGPGQQLSCHSCSSIDSPFCPTIRTYPDASKHQRTTAEETDCALLQMVHISINGIGRRHVSSSQGSAHPMVVR